MRKQDLDFTLNSKKSKSEKKKRGQRSKEFHKDSNFSKAFKTITAQTEIALHEDSSFFGRIKKTEMVEEENPYSNRDPSLEYQ